MRLVFTPKNHRQGRHDVRSIGQRAPLGLRYEPDQAEPDEVDERDDRAGPGIAAAEMLHFPGVNHLLVPAVTGEVSEYSTLQDKKVVVEIPARIAEFLRAQM